MARRKIVAGNWKMNIDCLLHLPVEKNIVLLEIVTSLRMPDNNILYARILHVVYMAYVSAAERAAEGLRASDAKAVIIAGVIAVTEGEVVSADHGRTIIRYYHVFTSSFKSAHSFTASLGVIFIFQLPATIFLLAILGMGLNFRKKGIG